MKRNVDIFERAVNAVGYRECGNGRIRNAEPGDTVRDDVRTRGARARPATERPVIGVYGGHARCRSAKHGGRKTRDVWEGGHKAAAAEALGIDWMTLGELSEAIPPAYTEYLGWQLRAALMLRQVA